MTELAEFVKVATVDQVSPGRMIRVEIDGAYLALHNVDGAIYATEDVCSHAEAALSEGALSGKVVTCPRHGATFDVSTGRALTLPAVAPLDTYAVRVEGNDILVDVSDLI